MPSTPTQVTPSSNPYLNAIQWGGWRWTDGAAAGTNITYYIAPGGIDATPLVGFGGLSVNWLPYQIAAYQAALQTWANVADITFTQVFNQGEADLAELIIGDGTFTSLGVHETPQQVGSDGIAWGGYNQFGAGFTEAGLQPGGQGFITLVHELGHALGLAHPHDAGGGSGIFPGVTAPTGSFGDNDLNQGIFTTMGHNNGWNVIGASPNLGFGWQMGPMAFDIAAIQYLYGANTTYHTGNDVYVIGAATMMTCIWDAGGTDAIAYSGSFAVTINLNAATLQNAPGGGGFVSYANGAPISSNQHWSAFTIANGVVIENATGGSGSDNIHLTSQNVNNVIDGNGGTDTVWVTYNFGSGYTVQGTPGNLVIVGAAGTDTLLDCEQVHFADGTTRSTAFVLTNPPDPPASDAPHDFNDDGRSDILFQHTNGQLYQYQVDGTSVTGAGFVGSNSDPNWQVVGTGDFNGDGRSDILFQNTNGQLYQYQMDGLSVTGAGFVGSNSDPNWQVVAAGDFNGDGRSDILFQNTNGQLYQYQMDGLSVTGAGFVGSNSDPNWQVVAAGDFDGNGTSDILFQNTNGQLYQYQMNGLSVTGAGFVGSNSDPNWQVVAAGDFNGDGNSDILFQNTNGQVYQYQMDGLSVSGAGFVGNNSDPNWQVVAAGDFDGNGTSDILFQHTNGQLYQWQIDGFSVTGAGFVGSNADPGWQIAL